MYKRSFTIIIIIFSTCIFCNSQCLEGKYQDSTGSYISFLPNQRVEFLLLLHTCLGDIYKAGYGTYKIKRKVLHIKIIPKYNGGTASQVEYTPLSDTTKSGTFRFLVLSKNDSTPISGVSISYYIGNGDMVILTDPMGRAEIRLFTMPKDSMIDIIRMDKSQPARILLNDFNFKGGMYTIRLADGVFDYVGFKEVIIPYVCYQDYFIGSYMKSKDTFLLKKLVHDN